MSQSAETEPINDTSESKLRDAKNRFIGGLAVTGSGLILTGAGIGCFLSHDVYGGTIFTSLGIATIAGSITGFNRPEFQEYTELVHQTSPPP